MRGRMRAEPGRRGSPGRWNGRRSGSRWRRCRAVWLPSPRQQTLNRTRQPRRGRLGRSGEASEGDRNRRTRARPDCRRLRSAQFRDKHPPRGLRAGRLRGRRGLERRKMKQKRARGRWLPSSREEPSRAKQRWRAPCRRERRPPWSGRRGGARRIAWFGRMGPRSGMRGQGGARTPTQGKRRHGLPISGFPAGHRKRFEYRARLGHR